MRVPSTSRRRPNYMPVNQAFSAPNEPSRTLTSPHRNQRKLCPPSPPHPTTPANTRRAGPQPNPPTTQLKRSAAQRLRTTMASLLDVPLVQAAQNVVPVAVTAGDKIEALRQWASGRCLSADRAGVYSRSEGGSGGRVRRVVRAE